MDTAGIVTGAVVAIVAGVVIPFLTSQFSLWSDRRRALIDARREALTAVIKAERAHQLRLAAAVDELMASNASGSVHTNRSDAVRISAARAKLSAMFTTSDVAVKHCFDLSAPRDHEAIARVSSDALMVLATWAAGRDIRARRAAKRLLVELKQKQSAPERDASNRPNRQPNQQTG